MIARDVLRIARAAALCFIALIAAMPAAVAQGSNRITRIGILSPFIGPDSAFFETLRQRLQELGYTEGRNTAYIYRAAEDFERLVQHAAEMVKLEVQVIVTAGAPGVRAAKSVTSTIPIVIANVGDAVAQGFVSSLARPGGNITGITSLNTELSAKRVEILREAVPSAGHFVALREAVGDSSPVRATEAVARAKGIRLEVMQVRDADEIASALSAASATGSTALVVIPGSLFASQLRRVVELAAVHHLPAIYPDARYVQAGGLISYGPNIVELYRQAAGYVDRIIKGAAPETLPVEQPTKFELAVNLRTARELGIAIPAALMVRADIVLQ